MSAEHEMPRTLAYARHIGRELALLSLSSLTQHYDESNFESLNLAEILERSVRVLIAESEETLESTGNVLEGAHERIEAIDPEDKLPDTSNRDLNTARKELVQAADEIKSKLLKEIQHLSHAVNLLGESLNIPLLRMLSGNPQVREFTLELVSAYREHKSDIDALIDSVSEDWPLERMNSIDRDLIRIAATEMVYDPIAAATGQDPTPLPVAINEAVELAKKYGTPESYRFVNAVLRNLMPHAEMRRRA